MKKIFWALLIFGFFSCKKDGDKDIYLGKLDELIVGDFSIKKDSMTKSIHSIRVVKEGKNEFIVTTSNARQFKGWAFIFRSSKTGEEVYRIEIPNEGPNAIKGGIYINYVDSPSRIFTANIKGEIAEYSESGTKINEFLSLKFYGEQASSFPLSSSSRILSNISTFASTAIPMVRMIPAIPGRVRVAWK